MGRVDIPYLRKVAESVKAETIWHVYWHDEKAEKCWKMLLIRWELHLNIEISTLIQNFGIDYELNVKREEERL